MTKFTTPKDLAFLKFFNELPSPIKEMAIENYHFEDDYTPKDLKDALWNFCVWDETPQGTSYWGAIVDMISLGKPITNPVHLLPEGYKFEEVKVMSAEEMFDKTISEYNQTAYDMNKFSFSKKEKRLFIDMMEAFANQNKK